METPVKSLVVAGGFRFVRLRGGRSCADSARGTCPSGLPSIACGRDEGTAAANFSARKIIVEINSIHAIRDPLHRLMERVKFMFIRFLKILFMLLVRFHRFQAFPLHPSLHQGNRLRPYSEDNPAQCSGQSPGKAHRYGQPPLPQRGR